jgi:hypothetical protein
MLSCYILIIIPVIKTLRNGKTIKWAQKAREFVPGKHLRPSVMVHIIQKAILNGLGLVFENNA